MPYELDKCVSKISGKNPKTNKPYTEAEKFAICTAQLKKAKSSGEKDDFILDADITGEVLTRLSSYKRYLYATNQASNEEDATAIMEEHLSKKKFNAYDLP